MRDRRLRRNSSTGVGPESKELPGAVRHGHTATGAFASIIGQDWLLTAPLDTFKLTNI